MYLFQLEQKVTNQSFVRKNHEKTFNCYGIPLTEEACVRDNFQIMMEKWHNPSLLECWSEAFYQY